LRLAQSPNSQFPLDWSRDWRFILYEEIAPRIQRDLWILPAAPASAPATSCLPTPFNEYMRRFSPESDESGRYEVYIDAFPEPRGKVQVSTAEARSRNGAPAGELFCVSADSKLHISQP
jgi:hypothetical protein